MRFKAQGVKCPSCGTLLNGKFKVRIRIDAAAPVVQEMEFKNGDTEAVNVVGDITGAEVVFPD
jgi:hypothetical protein